MKKKLKDETRTYPSVTLYRTDIEEILNLFTIACDSFTISDDEFEYDSLTELETKRGQVIKKLTVASESPVLSLVIGDKTEVKRGGSESVLSAYAQIQQLLKLRRRPVLYILVNPYLTIPFIVGSMVIVGLYDKIIPAVLAVPFALSIVGLMLATAFNHNGAYSKVLFIHEHERASFWTRNKDTIWVGIIVAAMTAFITWLITYFTTK